MTEFTIELWFKSEVALPPKKQYLFTMINNDTQKEYFSLYQDEDFIIKCVPFSELLILD